MAMGDCKGCHRPKKYSPYTVMLGELTLGRDILETHDDCLAVLPEASKTGNAQFYVCAHGETFEGVPRLSTPNFEVRTFLIAYVRRDDEPLTIYAKTAMKRQVKKFLEEYPGTQVDVGDVQEDLRAWHCQDMPVRGPVPIPGPD